VDERVQWLFEACGMAAGATGAVLIGAGLGGVLGAGLALVLVASVFLVLGNVTGGK
jgi:hypothetical protein